MSRLVEKTRDLLTEIPYDANKYELNPGDIYYDHVISYGLFGSIKKGWLKRSSTTSKTQVAIKCIKRSEFNEVAQFECLAREIKMLSALGRHVNVVGLEGAVTRRLTDGELYMVLEFCPGGDLKKFLAKHKTRFVASFDFDYFSPEKRQSEANSTCSSAAANIATNPMYLMVVDKDPKNLPLEPLWPKESEEICQNPILSTEELMEFDREFLTARDLVIFAYQIAGGMKFLHERSCLHRDLAARNVLVSSGNVLKISDFSLSKDIEEDEADKILKLPVKWVAPECLFYPSKFFLASDVWSYGVLLWELFELGEAPYKEIPNGKMCDFLLDGNRLTLPHYVKDDICALVNTCWLAIHVDRPTFAFLKNELAKQLPEDVIRYYEEKLC